MQLNIKIELPGSGAGCRLGHALLHDIDRRRDGEGTPPILLTFTDPKLHQIWHNFDHVTVSASVLSSQ